MFRRRFYHRASELADGSFPPEAALALVTKSSVTRSRNILQL